MNIYVCDCGKVEIRETIDGYIVNGNLIVDVVKGKCLNCNFEFNYDIKNYRKKMRIKKDTEEWIERYKDGNCFKVAPDCAWREYDYISALDDFYFNEIDITDPRVIAVVNESRKMFHVGPVDKIELKRHTMEE